MPGQDTIGGMAAFSLVLRMGSRATQKSENPTSYVDTIAPTGVGLGAFAR